jgi:8-oxo-dGTP diphosphatase
MEPNEAPDDALKREILEELSAPIDIDRFLCTVEYDYPKFHLTMHCYLCTLATESWTLNEHEAALWLSREELDTVKWLPADIEVLDMLRSAVTDKGE